MSNSDQISDHWPSSHNSLEEPELQQLVEKLHPVYLATLSREKIPVNAALLASLKTLYIPFCAWLSHQQKDKPLILGINGSQGSGKSTLSQILSNLLEEGFNKKVINFSIDDLYKTRKQRNDLAKHIHPLFKTRGVPGTHDAELGIAILKQVLDKTPSEIRIPGFDKSIDDRAPQSDWKIYNSNCDIVIFEGWCVGSIAQTSSELSAPINELEKTQDPDATWRNYANRQLKEKYSELYSLIDILVMLKIPDFNKVFEWRKLQEKKLRSTIDAGKNSPNNKTMNDDEIEKFIMHYERITQHTLREMPGRCDIVFELDNNHHIKNILTRRGA